MSRAVSIGEGLWISNTTGGKKLPCHSSQEISNSQYEDARKYDPLFVPRPREISQDDITDIDDDLADDEDIRASELRKYYDRLQSITEGTSILGTGKHQSRVHTRQKSSYHKTAHEQRTSWDRYNDGPANKDSAASESGCLMKTKRHTRPLTGFRQEDRKKPGIKTLSQKLENIPTDNAAKSQAGDSSTKSIKKIMKSKSSQTFAHMPNNGSSALKNAHSEYKITESLIGLNKGLPEANTYGHRRIQRSKSVPEARFQKGAGWASRAAHTQRSFIGIRNPIIGRSRSELENTHAKQEAGPTVIEEKTPGQTTKPYFVKSCRSEDMIYSRSQSNFKQSSMKKYQAASYAGSIRIQQSEQLNRRGRVSEEDRFRAKSNEQVNNKLCDEKEVQRAPSIASSLSTDSNYSNGFEKGAARYKPNCRRKDARGVVGSRADFTDASAIRRYALYRGMARSCRLSNFFAKQPEHSNDHTDTMSVVSGYSVGACSTLSSPTAPWEHEKNKYEEPRKPRRLPQAVPKVISEPDIPLNKWDLLGTTFPKRIYIRETVNGGIVDEIVDVRNERDWQILTYMSPLRHANLSSKQKTRDIKFQDLKDFEVYCYVSPWKCPRDN